MKFLVRTFLAWLPLAVAITGICLLVYATVQQNYRQSLNDPQIQIADDGARALSNGAVPASIVVRGVAPIDAAVSLAPWVAVYDESGTALESSAVLDGKPPMPPKGIFELVRSQGTNLPHNTWEPRTGVRIALVVVPVEGKNWYVAAGRNMHEVESREEQLSFFVLLAWVVLLVATFATKTFVMFLGRRP